MRILILGHGAVAVRVREALRNDTGTEIAGVICRAGREDAARAALGVDAAPSLEHVAGDFDLAVDCAGHAGLRAHGASILRTGIDLVTVSTGALADPALQTALVQAAEEGGARLEPVSGAIGALDALLAAKQGRLDRVVYRGRKPPAGWRGSPAEAVLDLDSMSAAASHFSGSARDAALRYPKNANVAASVALAGLGLDETQAELIADPGIVRNVHEVEAEGEFGRFTFRIEGLGMPENPKSSLLTALSVVAALRRRLSPLGL